MKYKVGYLYKLSWIDLNETSTISECIRLKGEGMIVNDIIVNKGDTCVDGWNWVAEKDLKADETCEEIGPKENYPEYYL